MAATTITLLISAISFALFIFLGDFLVFVFASFLNGASYVLWPLMAASVGSIAPEASRGRWISLSEMAATTAASIAPYVGGVLYETSSYTPFHVVICVFPLHSLMALTKPFKEQTSLSQIKPRQ